MTALQSIDTRPRTLRPWHLAAILVATLAVTLFAWTNVAKALPLAGTSVVPASLVAGDTGNVVVSFTTVEPVPSGGDIQITFPAGFNVSASTLIGSTGIASIVAQEGVSGQTVTITSDVVGNELVGAGSSATITLGGIVNPTAAGATDTFTITTRDGAGFTIDSTANVAGVTIVAGAYDAAKSTVSTSASEVVYGSTGTVSLTARDQYSNRILDLVLADVSFTLGDPSGGTFTGATHTGSGIYSATFTGTLVGSASLLTASYAGANAAGSPTIEVTRKPLTVTGVTAANKVYNANTTATLDVTGAGLYGVLQSDALDVGLDTSAATATFASADVGSGINVTVSGLSLTGERASNYTLTQPTTTADITAKPLTAPGVAAVDKVYDNTTTATLDLSSTGITLVEGNDIVQVSPDGYTATFASGNISPGMAVTVTGLALQGADAANYTLTQPEGLMAMIMPRAITVTAATQTREYEGTTASSGNPTVTSGSLVGDDKIAAITQTFDNRNIGTNKVMTPAGVVTDGNGGKNYNLTLTAVATGQITAHAITVTAQTDTKVYSGTVASAVTPQVTGGAVQTGDTPAFIQSFSLTGAGTNKSIIPSGVVTDGNGGTNYTYTFVNDTTGEITPRPVTAPGVTAVNKVYDNTTSAALDVSDPGLTAIETWDVVSVAPDGYTATFASADVADGIAVTVSGLALEGAGAVNYTLTQPTDLTANITARPITVTAATQTREYDGTTASSGIPTVTSGVLAAGDSIGAITQTFDSRNVGTNKVLTPAGVVTDGNGGNNYALTPATVATGEITSREITVTGVTASNKVYNGNTAATLNTNSAAFVGVLDGETEVFVGGTATGAFENDRVGTGMTVTVSGITATGSDSGNYTVTQPTVLADITAAPVTVTGVTVENKVYDGTTAATLGFLDATLNGVLLNDAPVGLYTADATATFASEDAGSGINVTVSGLSLGGERASNYKLTQPEGLTANITGAPLTVTGVTASDKVYNGNTDATVNANSATFGGVLGEDSVDVGGTATGTFADNIVGTNKTVTIAGISAGGADGGNYTVTQPTATASITAVPSFPSGSTTTPTPTATADPSGPVVTLTDEDSTVVTAGEPTSAQTQSSSGGAAGATAPANALPAGATLTAASIDNLEELTSQAPAPAGAQVVLAFSIEARDANGNALTEDFVQPVALEFNVSADSLPAGATAGEIVLAFWNGTSWTELQATVLFNADGTVTITASVDHFTIFSVQHQPSRGSFSPAPAFLVSFTVWGGGGYDLLDTAVGAGSAAWVMVDGRFHGYSVGAPAFVNASFRTMFPAGIASNTAVVVSRPTE